MVEKVKKIVVFIEMNCNHRQTAEQENALSTGSKFKILTPELDRERNKKCCLNLNLVHLKFPYPCDEHVQIISWKVIHSNELTLKCLHVCVCVYRFCGTHFDVVLNWDSIWISLRHCLENLYSSFFLHLYRRHFATLDRNAADRSWAITTVQAKMKYDKEKPICSSVLKKSVNVKR